MAEDDPKHPDPDAPPTEEEVAASKRLRDALEDPSIDHPDAVLARSLQAAWDPSKLGAEEHADIIDLASVPPDEITAASTLRDVLSQDDIAIALKAAWNPAPLSEADHRAI